MLVGPVTGSVLLEAATDSVFVLASRQVWTPMDPLLTPYGPLSGPLMERADRATDRQSDSVRHE